MSRSHDGARREGKIHRSSLRFYRNDEICRRDIRRRQLPSEMTLPRVTIQAAKFAFCFHAFRLQSLLFFVDN
jgi:hypothetical protein